MMKVLFITPWFPLPAHSGGTIAAVETLRSIHPLCELHLLTPRPEKNLTTNEESLQKLLAGVRIHYYQPFPYQAGRYQMYTTAARALVNGRSYWSMIWFNRALRSSVQNLHAQERFDVVHCEWLQPAVSLAGLDLPLVIRTLDVHFEGMRNWTETIPDADKLRKRFWCEQARRFRQFEAHLLNSASAVVAISPEDESTLRRAGLSRIVTIPPPRAVNEEVPVQTTTNKLVVFIGRLDMAVNTEAFYLFANEVWPKVASDVRDNARVVFAGGNPSDELRQRASDLGIEVRAPLSNSEAEELFRMADIFLSPVKSGTGIKIKTLEAMAYGKPMIGFEGAFRGVPIENNTHALIADTPAEFARLLKLLLADETLQQRIGTAAKEFVRLHFDPKVLGARLMTVYSQVSETYAQKSHDAALPDGQRVHADAQN